MKKLIISVVLSPPLFLTALPAFSALPSALENPALRTDALAESNYSKQQIMLIGIDGITGTGGTIGNFLRCAS